MQFPKVICRYHRKNWLPITLLLLTSAPTFSVLQPVTIIMRSLEPRSNGPITTASKSPSHPADLGEIVVGIRAMVAQQSLGSERAVADALNVKRHQVRRALTAMRANGELGLAQAKRKALLGPDSENLVRATNPMEVIEMRIAIEPFLARLAALRASPFEIAAIQAAATTPVGMDLGMVDLKFHKLVAASSGNRISLLRFMTFCAEWRATPACASTRTLRRAPNAHNSATPSTAPLPRRYSLAIRMRLNKRCGFILRPYSGV